MTETDGQRQPDRRAHNGEKTRPRERTCGAVSGAVGMSEGLEAAGTAETMVRTPSGRLPQQILHAREKLCSASTRWSGHTMRRIRERRQQSRRAGGFARGSKKAQQTHTHTWDARRSLLSARICSLRCFCFSSAFWYKSRCSDSFGGIRGLFLMNSIRCAFEKRFGEVVLRKERGETTGE